jgi:XTP/dITP diphosphohydrolase
MRKLLLATRNQGKLHELTQLLAGTPVKVVSLVDVGLPSEIEEKGETFRENAIHKAIEYSRLTDALTLSDDSGLEVGPLGGAPGVRSARYGGPDLNDEQRCTLLLKELEKVSWEDRKARFVSVLALAQSGAVIRVFEGTVDGLIAFEPRGKNGFGYDPIFYYPPRARTFGELPRSEKDRVSHRGRALRELREYIDQTM